MAIVTIRTSDGKVYTNPADVHIPRNEKNKMFYKLVDEYEPKPKEENTDEKTA